MECCKPDARVALACKDCKTLEEKKGDADKAGILSWFAPGAGQKSSAEE
jgi:hypothetical protein